MAAAGEETKSGDAPIYLVYGGKTGWIGQWLVRLLKERGSVVFAANARLENREDVARELDLLKPTYVLNAAGLTGRPNVDWCEDHKTDVIRVNITGTLCLADETNKRGIHMTNFATGCIYSYDDAHPIGGAGFTEEDKPNFDGSFYSATKAVVEGLLREYDNVLTLRVRMPISDDLSPRNFVTKITKYAKVVNIPNSMTVLTEMLPIALHMTDKGLRGVYNFTNPGAISHNQILDLYIKYIDPSFSYTNFTEEEQNKILKARRSNNTLDTSKIAGDIDVPLTDIHTAIVGVFERMRDNLKAAGNYPPPNPHAT